MGILFSGPANDPPKPANNAVSPPKPANNVGSTPNPANNVGSTPKPANNVGSLPKPAKYSFFSKPPDFESAFNYKLQKNEKSLMEKYNISDKDLDKDNLANVFIHKILNQENKNLNEKISDLDNLKYRLKEIWIRDVDKGVIQEIKDAIFIIKDHYNEYIKEIEQSITKLKANANAKAKAKAKANANAKAKANANAATLTAPTATPLGLTPLANSAAPPVVNNAAKNKATPVVNNAANHVEIVSTKKPVNNNSSQIKPLSQSNEILYSDIITKLKKLRDGMEKKIMDRFKEKKSEHNKNKKTKDPKIKRKSINPSLQGLGSDPVYRLITLFLIIQKLRGKLVNTTNNSKKLDENLKRLIKDYIYKLPEDTIFEKNKIKQITDLKNVGSTDELKKLKGEISKKKDSEIIKEFNEDIAKLFDEYIEVKNGQYIIDLPQLKGSSNNSQSNANPVESSNQNQGSKSGGSRKKSKKSRS